MSEWSGKSKGSTGGYAFFVFLLKYLGLYPAYVFLYFVVLYYFFFAPKTSKPAYRFFRHRIGLGPFKSIFKVYTNYYLLGQTLIDKVVVMAGFGAKFTSTSHGAENLRQLVAENRGGILLGAHIGNWEIAGHYISSYSPKINILIYDAEHQKIKEYLDNVIGDKKFNVITIKDDLSHVYAIGDALARKEFICMHADRFVQGVRNEMIDFFGEKAAFPIGAFQLIKSFKVPYTFVYGIKTANTHYDFFARPLKYVTKESTIKNMMEDYARDLEGMVKQYPEQWFNFYDFWKKTEADATDNG